MVNILSKMWRDYHDIVRFRKLSKSAIDERVKSDPNRELIPQMKRVCPHEDRSKFLKTVQNCL